MHIKLTKNGVTKEVKIGFSWTNLFFGAWVPLLRGMWLPFFVYFITLGFAGFYYPFVINRKYACKLAEDGWKVRDSDIDAAWKAWGIDQ